MVTRITEIMSTKKDCSPFYDDWYYVIHEIQMYSEVYQSFPLENCE